MRFELRGFAILCALAVAACSQHSGSAPLLPMEAAHSVSSRETVVLPDAGAFKPLYPFGKNASDGSAPTFLVSFNGDFYGTTTNGGVNNLGVVFSVKPGGGEKVLHALAFSEGANPVGPMVNVLGLFYGTTTSAGGSLSLGSVFTIDPGNGNFNVIHKFAGAPSDGSQPYGGLVGLNGKLYGTTAEGGANNAGTVYNMTTAGVVHVIHSFNFIDGSQPYSTMIVINGDLYGTTSSGGKFGAGEIFRVTPAGNLKIVHSFGKGTDGASPWFGALIDFDGDLYGTTLTGGTKGIGTIYTSTLTGTEKVLYSFKSTASTGCEPNVGLVALNGGLYGTSIGAPTCPGNGTVYQVGGSAGITTLHKFAGGKGGGSPYGLVPMNSTLYGLTAGGGEFNQGLFYSVTP